MAFMIVVSNRLPFVLKRDKSTSELTRHSTAGGLVTAMSPVVKETNSLWVGWPGADWSATDRIPRGKADSPMACEQLDPEQVRPVDIPTDLFDDFYNGCCNASFWPLLHSMPDK